MVRALQVLRIHLLELEKVQELCKDFCSKYVVCIKEKMQSENVLRPDNDGYDSDEEIGYLKHDNNLIEVPVSRSYLRYYSKMHMKSKQIVHPQSSIDSDTNFSSIPAMVPNDTLRNFSSH